MNALTTLLTFAGGQPAAPQRSTPTGAEGFESVLLGALPQAAAETAEQGSEPALDLHAKIESLPLEYAPRPAMILQAIATVETTPATPTVAEQSDAHTQVPALAPAEAPVDGVPMLPAAGSPVLSGMSEINPSAPTGTIGVSRTEPAPEGTPNAHTTEEVAAATPANRPAAPATVEGTKAPAPAAPATAPSAEQVEPGKAPASLPEPLSARPMEPNRLIVPPTAPVQPTARPRSDTAPAAPTATTTATAAQPLTVSSAVPTAPQEQAPATAHSALPVTAQTPTAPRPEPVAPPLENPVFRTVAPVPVEQAVMPTSPQQPAPAPAPVATPQAPAAPAPAPAPLNEQLTKPIYSLVRQGLGEHTMTLTVTPDELGPVTVRATIGSEGAVRVELFTGSDTARESLRAILVDLRRDLAGQGIGSNLDLSAHDRPQQDSRRADQERRWHREHEPEPEQPQTPHRRMYDHGSSLNVMA